MNKNYSAPEIKEFNFDLSGVLCLSPVIPDGAFEDVEREEFPW